MKWIEKNQVQPGPHRFWDGTCCWDDSSIRDSNLLISSRCRRKRQRGYPIQMTCIHHIISYHIISYHIISYHHIHISRYIYLYCTLSIWSRRFVRPVLELVARALGDSFHLFDEPGVWGRIVMKIMRNTYKHINMFVKILLVTLCLSIHVWNFLEHLKVGAVSQWCPTCFARANASGDRHLFSQACWFQVCSIQ